MVVQMTLEQKLKESKSTPFISHLIDRNNNVNLGEYNLIITIRDLKIVSIGLSVRNFKLKNVRDYFGVKGRTAAEILPQLEKFKIELKELKEKGLF